MKMNRWLDILKSFLAHFKPFLGSQNIEKSADLYQIETWSLIFCTEKASLLHTDFLCALQQNSSIEQ